MDNPWNTIRKFSITEPSQKDTPRENITCHIITFDYLFLIMVCRVGK